MPTPSPPPPLGGYDSPEYRLSNGALAAGAISAYEQGASGAGIRIGIVDSGIDTSYLDFAGRISAASGDAAGSRSVSDQNGHGTAVSAIAAAALNGENQHGVAFASTIVAVRADTPGTCTALPGSCRYGDAALAAGVAMAHNAGARVINLSIESDGAGPQLLAAVDAATRAGIIVVVAAGNSGGTASGAQPGAFAAGLVQQAGNGLVIIAGSIGGESATAPQGVDLNQISSFSNRAGDLGQNYLTALGFRVVAPNIQDQSRAYYYSGTSFSAPVISGAVALLAQAFPNLTSEQIVALLYRTADDLGAAGVDGVFGQGRLNLARAFQPVGTTTLAGSTAQVSLTKNGRLPAAAGDARPAAASAVILDEFDRPFRLDLSRTLTNTERRQRQLARALLTGAEVREVRLSDASFAMTYAQPQGTERSSLQGADRDRSAAQLMGGRVMGRLDDRTSVAIGAAEGASSLARGLAGFSGGGAHPETDATAGLEAFGASRTGSLAFRRQLDAMAVTVAAEHGSASDAERGLPGGARYHLVSSTAAARLGGFGIGVTASLLREAGTVLGGEIAPTLGEAGAATRFLDVEVDRGFGGGWSGRLSYRRGWTSFAGGDGRLGGLGWAGELGKRDSLRAGDRLTLSLAQPFRIEEGGLMMSLPETYDWRTGEVAYARQTLSFVPRGREMAARASYGLPVAASWLSLDAFWRNEPGHFADADADIGASLRWKRDF